MGLGVNDRAQPVFLPMVALRGFQPFEDCIGDRPARLAREGTFHHFRGESACDEGNDGPVDNLVPEFGVRHFGLSVASERLGLSGKLDMAIETAYGWYPVDFKYSHAGPSSNHRYQVVAYAALLEDEYGKPVRAGFIYLVPRNDVHVIEITGMRLHFRRLLTRIRNAVASGVMPPLTVFRGKCRDCEYRNYCADR